MSGQVVLISGAGRGLGRAYAVEAARRGASVAVVDTGAGLDGSDGDPSCAERVAEEIRAGGGQAVAASSDVATTAGAEAAVALAVESLGGLDAIVCNAGILRDRTFKKMSDDDFVEVLRVHLLGASRLASASWPHLSASEAGRLVLISSASGLYGQFGQANYASAKAGMVGLLNVLKQEGARAGVLVNVVAPVARTRMTEDLLPEGTGPGLGPELVAPLVAYLCSATCTEGGHIFEVGGGLVARAELSETETLAIDPGDSLEQLAETVQTLAGLPADRPFSSSGAALERIFDHVAPSD